MNDDLLINVTLLRAAIQPGRPLASMTEQQALAWAAQHAGTIKLVRDYLENPANGLTRPSLVETQADPNGPLDPTLTAQIIGLFEMAGTFFVRVPGA